MSENSRQDIVDACHRRWECRAMEIELAQASAKLVEQQNEIERLREALIPFAEEAKHWDSYLDEEPVVEAFPGYDGTITVGDLRQAFSVLEK